MTAANQEHAADSSDGQPGLVPVFLTVAVRTGGGNGPGVVRVPRDEASRIIARRHGVAGERPARGYEDGGAEGRVIAAMVPRPVPPGRGM